MCHNPRIYFRLWLEHVLGFVNNGSRGRDPSRRWAHGHVFGEDARPRAPRGRARTERCIFLGGTCWASLTIRQLPDEDAIPPGDGPVVTHSGRARVPARREDIPEPKGVFSSVVRTRAGLR
jgi:hypothetical protein